MQINIEIPCLIEANDYYEFDYINDVYKKLDSKLCCVECGSIEDVPLWSSWVIYLGLIYYKGSKPRKNKIDQMKKAYLINKESR